MNADSRIPRGARCQGEADVKSSNVKSVCRSGLSLPVR